MAEFDGLNLDNALKAAAQRSFTEADIESLQSMHPYLELMAIQGEGGQPYHIAEASVLEVGMLDRGEDGVPAYIHTRHAWNIQYWPGGATWPPVLSASNGAQVYYGEQPIFTDAVEPVGTLKSQCFEVALVMMILAKEQQWPAIRIISGAPEMLTAAWIVASMFEIVCEGYEPTEQDQARLHRVQAAIDPALLLQQFTYTVSDQYQPDQAFTLGAEQEATFLPAVQASAHEGAVSEAPLNTHQEFGGSGSAQHSASEVDRQHDEGSES